MKLERTATSYAVEIDLTKMQHLLISEAIYTSDRVPTHEQLDVKLMEIGCTKVDYNGHFGPYVYLTISYCDDTAAKRAEVLKLIQDHLAGLRT